MWVLLAVAIVVIGFALRLNAMLVVAVAGIAAGLIAGMSPVKLIETFGTGFASSRSVTVFIVVLPVIGLLERHGLMQQAGRLMSKGCAVRALHCRPTSRSRARIAHRLWLTGGARRAPDAVARSAL